MRKPAVHSACWREPLLSAAGDGVVSGGEAGGGDGCGLGGAGDLSAGGRPDIGCGLFAAEVGRSGGDGDGVAGEGVGGLGDAAELDGGRGFCGAEAEGQAGV